jgi:hypothetical protein
MYIYIYIYTYMYIYIYIYKYIYIYTCVLGQCGSIEDELIVTGSRDLADSLRIIASVAFRPLGKKESIQEVYKEMIVLSSPLQRLLCTIQTQLSRQKYV